MERYQIRQGYFRSHSVVDTAHSPARTVLEASLKFCQQHIKELEAKK